ncbi:hypothetical protein Golomagni_07232 [Golovinomyces magnicellulatus]|nr:hypothetical protein Golomagni_07232 [Golovinomyces magnicellulatus]
MGLFKGDMTKESNKAAQILKSFVDKQKIPQEVIANAKGIAIFTAFRAGMYFAGTSGSGILIARLPDGTWSAPSAYSVRAGGFGFVYGVDVYDCVCVLNTQAAVDAYTSSEITMGGSVAVAAGPLGRTGKIKDTETRPVWTYTKSRGLYGGVTVDGTVIKEKTDVNASAYGKGVTASSIVTGKVQDQSLDKWHQLAEVVKLAEGNRADGNVLGQVSTEATPGDYTE